MTIMIHESEAVCGNCKHFRQHYTLWPEYHEGYYPLNCGHCVKPRVKQRRPGNEGCVYWIHKNL